VRARSLLRWAAPEVQPHPALPATYTKWVSLLSLPWTTFSCQHIVLEHAASSGAGVFCCEELGAAPEQLAGQELPLPSGVDQQYDAACKQLQCLQQQLDQLLQQEQARYQQLLLGLNSTGPGVQQLPVKPLEGLLAVPAGPGGVYAQEVMAVAAEAGHRVEGETQGMLVLHLPVLQQVAQQVAEAEVLQRQERARLVQVRPVPPLAACLHSQPVAALS
jgi:hypothetical protein